MPEIVRNEHNSFIFGIKVVHAKYIKGGSWAAKLGRYNTRIFAIYFYVGFYSIRFQCPEWVKIPFTHKF